jgi:arabinan endo-1,5-alpha-L-arabinosidase
LYKQEPQSAIASYYAKFIDYAGQPTASNISVTKSAPETTENITLEYTSKNTDVIANDGTIYPQTEDTKVGITPVYINCGDFVYKYTSFATKNLNVKAGDAENGAVAFYPLDALDNTNLYDATQKMTAYKSGTATMPRIDEDSERGNVLHQFKTADINNCSYVRMPNPLYNSSAEEFTVNFWVKPISPRSIWGAYFSFFEGTTPTASGGRFYITDNSYIGYNGSAGWFDINKPDTVTYYDIPMGKWSMVTMTASSSGVTFYVNGYPHTAKLWNSGTGGTEEQFNYTGMLSDINTYPYMYLGAGSWWGSAGCYLSDLKVFDRSLSESDVQALRLAQPAYIRGDVNGDGVVNGTDIQAVINFIVIGEYDKKADVNEDGKVNGTDIQEIINIIVNAE